MHPARLSNALEDLSWVTIKRLSWSVKALVATVTALVVGFLVGGAAIGPMLADNSPDNTAAVQARFERRTVDPQGNYPDPFPYRVESPDFGTQSAPRLGAYARQRAQREFHGERGTPVALPPEAANAFGSAAAPEQQQTDDRQSSQRQQTYDRHTGVSY